MLHPVQSKILQFYWVIKINVLYSESSVEIQVLYAMKLFKIQTSKGWKDIKYFKI